MADFQTIADYYDAMYVDEDAYRAEAEQVRRYLCRYQKSKNQRLLDIACGTGGQSRYLAQSCEVTGLDLSGEMLRVAREKVPGARFIEGDMCAFRFDELFGAAVNLYGSIGFVQDAGQLKAAFRCAYDALEPGGVFLLTPWGTKETFRDGLIADSGERGGIGYCRMETVTRPSEGQARVEMFHLIGRGTRVEQFHFVQTISLWSETEYRTALEQAGFTIAERISDREFRMGAFVCVKESC